MKVSESWLREWVNPAVTTDELVAQLTMAGLEVEGIEPVAKPFTDVIIGEVLVLSKHPEADRLQICSVSVGEGEPLSIVCGASNVYVGMKVAVAMIGAKLPNDLHIKASKIRGVPSAGMLCSALELGLREDGQGLLDLPKEAPLGESLRDYLNLADHIIEVSITPNRGDCLSIRGLAREVSALTNTPYQEPVIKPQSPALPDVFPIQLEASDECPRYVGRIVRGINPAAQSPIWLQESLRRSGVRSISPAVDVTNFVMLELGQPMHAFDFDKLHTGMTVRLAKRGESVALLDDTVRELTLETLIIADAKGPLAIAGVMGGKDSAVTAQTTSIFFESAYFTQASVAKSRQHYQIQSDSAYRFERGVEAGLQEKAIERATELLISIAGGKAGPLLVQENRAIMPQATSISLSAERLEKVLGFHIQAKDVERILSALGFTFQVAANEWLVTVPLYRPDISLPEDLIEEVVRLHGYDKIPMATQKMPLQSRSLLGEDPDWSLLRQSLADMGYAEIISYSFVDENLQRYLGDDTKAVPLVNPITTDMTVMRTNLWSGLLKTFKYNQARQLHRQRLFELGACFTQSGAKISQNEQIAGLITGSFVPLQWSNTQRDVDFYDIKGDVEQLLSLYFAKPALDFRVSTEAALHPGQAADIYYGDTFLGHVGLMHPSISEALDCKQKIYLFSLNLQALSHEKSIKLKELSNFQESRRDLALLIAETVPSSAISDTIKRNAGDWLKDVFIFDVYQGKGIVPGLKSIALALILQHPTQTLKDEEITSVIERVTLALKRELGADLRS